MDTTVLTTPDRSEQERIRHAKLMAMRAAGVDPFPPRFGAPQPGWPLHTGRTHTAAELHERYAQLPSGQDSTYRVCVAGRVVSKRDSGKLAFVDIVDGSGAKLQLFCDLKGL
ncbi:MAG: hypothetical protein KGR26_13470, partial [Cyanobacteria bacterium REEB65]|nr:hypothetical protein [Cyanobacteria bacterium REEB65]